MSLRAWMHPLWRRVAGLLGPRMIYGWRSGEGVWRAHTRVSSHTRVEQPARWVVGDHVFVGHFNWLDASEGLRVDEGCQITNFVSILTHSSHQSLRVGGQSFWGQDRQVPGRRQGPVRLGAYTFVGPHSVIAPGVTIGRGVLIKAFSLVDSDVPDFAVVGGAPASVMGDTREQDEPLLQAHPDWRAAYEAWARR